jgi:glycogen synthase
MHVLMTADTVGGVWTYTQDLVSELVGRGNRITLVSFGGLPAPDQTTWLRNLPEVDYRPTSYRLEWMQDAASDVEAARKYLAKVIRDVRPDLLHSNQFCFGSLDHDIPRAVVAHSDVVSWWQAVHGSDPPQQDWAWYRRQVQNGLRGADLVVAPSRWMMGRLEANFHLGGETHVIYNGRNPSLFKPGHARANCALSVGRLWDKGKHCDLLLDADLDIPVYIAGASTEPGAIPTSRTANAEATFMGPMSQADLIEQYSRTSIYVATSCYEPFGLAPVEAALSRCALVLNDLPVFRELWGDDAVYFARDNARSLSQEVSRLARSASAQRELANRAQRRAQEKFTASRMADGYCKVYEQVRSRERVA